MIKKLLLLLMLTMPMAAMAQCCSQTCAQHGQKAECKWVRKHAPWMNGFTKGKPGVVNMAEFKQQYKRNRKQWDTLFAWLEQTDLDTLKAGKYAIPGTTMTASVQDDTNKPLEKRRSESHRKKIDFQFVVRGTEGFVLLNHDDAATKPNCEYDAKKDVIHYDYDPAKAWQFATTAPRFNIFFPCDWHVAKAVTKEQDQHFRVIVVKVDYIE